MLSDHHPYRGVNHDEPFELRTTLAELGNYPTSHKICLAPQLGGSKQLPLFEEGELPSEVVRQHYDRSLPPAVYIYGLKGHELGGAGFLHSGGRVFLAPDVMPAYFGQRLRDDGHSLDECQRGALFREDVITINLDGPVASVLHPNLVYGHFLLEIFPKLHLLSRLRAAGLVFPVALPEQISPWVKAIVGLYFSPEEILHYDVRNTRIRSPCFVLPSMMHVNYQFHPDFNLAIEEIKGHVLRHVSPGRKKRIWISTKRSREGLR